MRTIACAYSAAIVCFDGAFCDGDRLCRTANAYGNTAYGEQVFYFGQYENIENYTYAQVGWCILGASIALLVLQLSPITTLLLVCRLVRLCMSGRTWRCVSSMDVCVFAFSSRRISSTVLFAGSLSVRSSSTQVAIMFMSVIETYGIVVSFNDLNVYTLVNLCMAVSMSVQFCTHIANHFLVASSDFRGQRVVRIAVLFRT